MMHRPTKHIMRDVLAAHRLWLADEGGPGARRAVMDGWNLSGMDLCGAELGSASLRSADLTSASLDSARLRGADLYGATLSYSSCANADFTDAVLDFASLYGANCLGAVFIRVSLSRTSLQAANLSGATFVHALLPPFQIPQEGHLVGYRRLDNGVTAKLLVTGRRTACMTSRACRCDEAVVMEGEGALASLASYASPGIRLKAHDYFSDSRTPKGGGITFFLTSKEAELAKDY